MRALSSAPPRDARGGPAGEPLVVPVGRGGLALTDRVCWFALAAAMAASASLILYLNRGTTFFLDQVFWVLDSPDLGPGDVIEPHNGHLIATTRLAHKAVLETVGIDYLTFRILGVLALIVSVGLLYAIAKRRIGALPALAPALVLLFYGSAFQHVVIPIGFTAMLSIAAGLAALLALERGHRLADLGACALLVLSVATFSVGLAFLVGVAISVMIRPDRWGRAWIFLVPAALYAAWWVYSLSAPGSAETQTMPENVLLIPSYVAESLAAVTASLTGLSYSFGGEFPPVVELGWGRVLAAAAVVGLAVRIRRGNVPASLWISLGVLLTFWSLGAIAFGEWQFFREPWQSRFIFTGTVMFLLVATAAASGVRFSRLGLAALFAVAAASLATNVALLRDGAAHFRDAYSAPLRAQLAMLELARDHVDPQFDPVAELPSEVAPMTAPAGRYLAVVDRYGSPAASLTELERQRETVRQGADQVLAAALRLGIEPGPTDEPEACVAARPGAPGGEVGFELPPAGAILIARAASPAPLTLGRFADSPSVELGELVPGEPATLRIPRDPSPRPWRATASGAAGVAVCPLA